MLRRLVLMLALVLAPLAGGAALAHQQKIAISTVSVNPRTGMIEIVHQVPVHDAEHALRQQGVRLPDIVGSAKSREDFARYVTTRFMLEVNGVAVTPAYVGSEISGGSLMVYQEAPGPDGEASVRVNSQILTDVWARQENRVNLGRGADVTTFIFTGGEPPREGVLTR
ncbi:DUF6702 family protein [Erythrobacter dokdonensis]|uniref:Uncharacterized protein n=1 Tax=Erythrobacter dokdonensis DSW-74 TaxID=1300349 RepID=A0A1A7BGN5_9SPHN|nr:DUF6702 family protein [Erythrobacter dokdonensis]OBV10886.1 hypothetical protein I603_2099 [Erythrobacter dokdonensis DSW-74]